LRGRDEEERKTRMREEGTRKASGKQDLLERKGRGRSGKLYVGSLREDRTRKK
jgi:hypothetical protein